MSLFKCEIHLDLNWSKKCVIVDTAVAGRCPKFSITDTKSYGPLVNLSTQDNTKLLEQLKSGFKRTFNWNKYQSKTSTKRQDYLINLCFQRKNILFVSSLEDEGQQTSYKQYYLPTIEIKNYYDMMDRQNIFDRPVTINSITYDIATGQGDDYTTGCLLDYNYFRDYYKIIAIDLIKQQEVDADPKAIQHVNFTRYLDQQAGATIVFITKEEKDFRF